MSEKDLKQPYLNMLNKECLQFKYNRIFMTSNILVIGKNSQLGRSLYKVLENLGNSSKDQKNFFLHQGINLIYLIQT